MALARNDDTLVGNRPALVYMASLAGRTIVVTGGSRGIGLAIAKRAAQDGANVVLAAKTVEPHPILVPPGDHFHCRQGMRGCIFKSVVNTCEAVGKACGRRAISDRDMRSERPGFERCPLLCAIGPASGVVLGTTVK